jgi:chemotaxis protein methyltransferase CheR
MSDAWWASLADDRPRLLARLRALLGEHTGLRFPPERWSNIERVVERVGRQQGYADARTWLEWFLAAPPGLAHLEPLLVHLTIGETYFFRDQALFRALRDRLLPELIEQRRAGSRYLRFWSAGCSTGEEPYSIAIALQRMLPDWPEWHISLIASDINPQSLAKARAGRYDAWSFRGGLPQPLDPAFERVGPQSFQVAPQVRALVRFTQLNLADAEYPGTGFDAFDFIFCRNVLMYLDASRARAALARMSAALVEGGWLVLSAVESSLVDLPQMKAVRLDDLILFRKLGAVQADVPAPSASIVARLAPTLRSLPAVAIKPLNAVATVVPAITGAAGVRGAARRPVPRVVEPEAGAENTGSVLVARARSSADGGRLEEAARYCEAAIAADKLNPSLTDLHASILLEQGAPGAAETALKRTLYLDADRVQTHVRLANLLWGQPHRRAEGLRHFRTALELLAECADADPVADTDGMTAVQLRTLIQTAIAHDVAGTYGRSA